MSKKDRRRGNYREPETLADTHRPAGPPQSRESASQKAQLESEKRQGTRKDVKRQMSYKTGRAEWDEKAQLETSRTADPAQELLDADKDLRGYGLKAEVRGSRAIISGVVDTLAEKQRAEELVRQIPGVQEVESAIALSTDGPIDDRAVAREVRQELAAAPGVDRRRVGAEVHAGTAVLKGTVYDKQEARTAARAAAKARGVRRVVSHLRPPEPEDELEHLFHQQVRNDGEQL
ncbi:MAG: BON domain-containing protein [Clostridia bacterium]|jgi:hyperosmotically inducible protein|nr:BON domain-containing protein [Clostridia bacterium]MDH7572476.1 BON domain-containing protein [Clostridia bacterium]